MMSNETYYHSFEQHSPLAHDIGMTYQQWVRSASTGKHGNARLSVKRSSAAKNSIVDKLNNRKSKHLEKNTSKSNLEKSVSKNNLEKSVSKNNLEKSVSKNSLSAEKFASKNSLSSEKSTSKNSLNCHLTVASAKKSASKTSLDCHHIVSAAPSKSSLITNSCISLKDEKMAEFVGCLTPPARKASSGSKNNLVLLMKAVKTPRSHKKKLLRDGGKSKVKVGVSKDDAAVLREKSLARAQNRNSDWFIDT